MTENNGQTERKFSEKYAALWPELSDADRRELAIFEKAVEENLGKFEEDPSVSNKRNLDHSKRGLRELRAGLDAKYLKKDDRFSDRSEALKWLRAKGFRIGKTKFYADSKKGLIRLQPDRSVLKKDLKQYAQTLVNTGDPRDKTLRAHRVKLEAECRRLEKQNQLLDFDLQEKKKKYILRTEAGVEQAGLIIVLEANIKNLFFRRAPDWVQTVDGNQKRIPDLQDQFSEDLNELFRAIARTEEFTIRLSDGD